MKTKMKDFLTKKQFKEYVNKELFKSEIVEISSYRKDAIIFKTKMLKGCKTAFCPVFFEILSVNFNSDEITYVLQNANYDYIVSNYNYKNQK